MTWILDGTDVPRLVSWVSTQVSTPFSRLREKVPEGRMRVSSDGTYWPEKPSSVAARHLLPEGEGSNQAYIEAVFISDLHLHPNETAITERFNRFIQWASTHTRAVYILGDFFHVWPGDDALDDWSRAIAHQLAILHQQGIATYFMQGNRDFLLGDAFAALAGATLLTEPAVITLGDERVLLVHGDRYCILDRGHQWLRRLTRNRVFPWLFLRLPLAFRQYLVNTVRQKSQSNRSKPPAQMDVVATTLLNHMTEMGVNVLIHGHTHKPGLTTHRHEERTDRQYVLSDWDDNPLLMCYDEAKGFYFSLLPES